MADKEWFSWNDGGMKNSVRLNDVNAVVERPSPGASSVYVRGGTQLMMGYDDAVALKRELGIKE